MRLIACLFAIAILSSAEEHPGARPAAHPNAMHPQLRSQLVTQPQAEHPAPTPTQLQHDSRSEESLAGWHAALKWEHTTAPTQQHPSLSVEPLRWTEKHHWKITLH